MRVAVDTNVLVRAVVRDDPAQADIAAKVLTDAELIAIALPCLCEFVWVLRGVYGFQPSDTGAAISHAKVLAIQNGIPPSQRPLIYETLTSVNGGHGI
ncbi:MAG: hypothetical protein ACHP7O_10780, partial [Burkholderiales bacterium]